jgi:large subunit ribosomal protein L31
MLVFPDSKGGHNRRPRKQSETPMKADIHPNYQEVAITCSCGNTFTTRSASGKAQMHIEVCSECHPFYTGKQKIVDTAGRVERFRQKYGNVQRLG